MARNIFNQPPKDEKEPAAPPPAPVKSTKLPGSVGGLRDSLREITANSIRDIEPDRIDMDGLRDRLILEDSSIEDLAESIRKHGQQVPIMVRPSEQPDRYRIIYGRRRLAAIRRIGGTVKSLFIKEMQEAGYKPGVIQDALGLTRQGVSNHRVVIGQLPDELVPLIGPAHGVGRRQWGDLAALSEKVPLVDIARETLAALPDTTPSSDKFQAVYVACTSKARGAASQSARGQTTVVKDKSGSPVGTLSVDGKQVAIKIARKDNPEFGQWLEERAETTLRQLFEQWRNERGSGA